MAIATAPIRAPREAHDIYAISTLDAYLAAAQAGSVSESLGPLLALSILADKRGLAGEEIREAILNPRQRVHDSGVLPGKHAPIWTSPANVTSRQTAIPIWRG